MSNALSRPWGRCGSGDAMLLPYSVDVPMERWPWANWLLIAATVVVSIASWLTSESLRDVRDAIRLVSQDDPQQIQKESKRLERRLREPPPPALALRRDHFGATQLFTYVFVHADVWHLIGNMVFLFCFGNAVNAKLGHVSFLVIYFLLGAVAGLCWLALGAGDALVGASGAIMGVTGVFVVLYPKNEVRCWFGLGGWGIGRGQSVEIMSFGVVLLGMGLDLLSTLFDASGGIAYVAHLGGELVGVGLGLGLLLTGLVTSEYYEENLLQMFGVQPRTERVREASRGRPVKVRRLKK